MTLSGKLTNLAKYSDNLADLLYPECMPDSTRPRRDFQALENRRLQAAKLFQKGERLASVARAVKASRQSVSRWYRQWKKGGLAALRSAGRAGRKPKLSANQLRKVEAALQRGPRANGFGTELWTLPRVAAVIERVSGVRYHPGHVWRVLRALGWSLQRPARRARERDEEAIRQWISQRWPAVKKTPGAERLGFCSKTRAGSASNRRFGALGRHGARPPF